MTTTRARRHAMIHATPAWRWLAAVLALSFATASVAGPPPLIPMPAAIAMADGERTVDATTVLRFDDDRAAPTARYFSDLLERTFALRLATDGPDAADAEKRDAITFVLDDAMAESSPEAYRLAIDDARIEIRASDPRGLFYGATTLWQLLTASVHAGDGFRLPALRIDDAPRFAWRGYMLDSARHFHDVDDVKRVIDAMALHKLNVFHWHLTDDQGWRIEIRKHPKLAETGGCRALTGDAAIDEAGKPRPPSCGWYTQDQIRDIVAYAAQRHVMVVPEIDVPGHATAAIAAYPQLGVTGEPMPVSNQRGIHANLFNVEEATFDFLADVFAEVAELFPSPYIHVGGDEALKDQWQASPRVQARMRALGIIDETGLQSWFIHRLETILAAHDRKLVGWDEILEGGLAPNATVMSWRGTEGGVAAARSGHDVVMSPVSALYLDYLQTSSPNEPAGRPKLNTLQTFYRFEPVPAELDAAQRRHVLGLQANMWTGDTRTFAGVEHNSFPRLAAVAETGWTPAERKDYVGFLQRLPAQLLRYRLLGIGYAETPFEPMLDAIAPDDGEAFPYTHARVALSNPLGYTIRYTVDGSVPDARSPRYDAPLRLSLGTVLHAAAFAGGHALAPARNFDTGLSALRSRADEALALCTQDGPVLRMEDDGPVQGPRALFNVAIFEPCWRWADAPLDGIAGVRVRAGRLPYLIHLGEDDAKRRFLPAETAHGELDIRAGGCDGARIATAPLPQAPGADGFTTVEAPLAAAMDGARDLCIRFSGDTRPAMWVLDRIELLPALQE